jgi:hypothetical protein
MRFRPRYRRRWSRRRATALLAATAALSGCPLLALASGTRPQLAITAADGVASSAVRSVAVTGTFNFDDRVQWTFPVGLIVYQANRFACFDASGTVDAGTSSAVVDGIDANEVAALLAGGAPASAPAALVQVRPERIVVTLPPEFTPGTASVVLYAQKEDKSFVSNTVSLVLP